MSVVNSPAASSVTADTTAWRVLSASTFAFNICFAVWMMFAILGIPLKQQLHLTDTEFGLIAATPVLTGSLARVPLGIWTDRHGGRIVFFCTMAVTIVPIWLIAYATAFWQFLVLGLFVGIAGGSFSVGTPCVARWFPKARQGLAMGVFGAGNSGAALNKFVAPVLMLAAGTWAIVPRVYSILQEALSNVRKHAEARHVNVTIVNDSGFSLLVEDDGLGYDPGDMGFLDERHVGFHIMRERAERLSARLQLTGSPRRGARVELILPTHARQAV
ncbi:nitrite extrusion protein [Caballeronia concitans]|uniref:Nitrite extrusion protein n=1 Tax=Caballeronia concitans TaxID=1777133 RepID=A0A658QZI3_9BURK|nr:MFS transporter [Caballeronia concitans]KIG10621.1 major facilitator superfamily MFS_1 [Burkholderia sp. MR1]SAL35344.1 nitrite extrusion protein [Caballeronia concitans]